MIQLLPPPPPRAADPAFPPCAVLSSQIGALFRAQFPAFPPLPPFPPGQEDWPPPPA